MDRASSINRVETGGSFDGSLCQAVDPVREEEAQKFASARVCEFLSDLIGDRRKEVALRYWPIPEESKNWRPDRIEAYVKQKRGDLDRMLLQHHDRPPTVRLLFAIVRALGPEAGVRIAHFFDDELGTERGAVKVNPKRIQDDLGVVKKQLTDITRAIGGLVHHVEVLEAQVSKTREGR